jgi:hypothetical protein
MRGSSPRFLGKGLIALGLCALAPWAFAACGGDGDTVAPGAGGSSGSGGSGGDSGGSSSGGGAGKGAGGSSAGSAGKGGSGGSSQGGSAGSGEGGEGGEPPTTEAGQSQYGFVAAGERSTSANFVFIGSLGEGPGGSTLMASPNYRMEGGVIATD